jgi:3-oxoacyl-[acyl-carrier protein] reductase
MSKVVLVTGTRKGIGKDLSLYFLEKGHTVIGCSRGAPSIIHANYRHFELDVSDEGAVTSMVRDIKKNFGRIDILLNNAGIASMNHLLLSSLKTAHNIFNTNFFGTFLFMREVAKIMSQSKQGRIVNFSTVAVPLRLEGEALYAASKAAVVSLTEVGARELAKFNITVNAIGPTPINTDLIRGVPKDKIAALLARQAITRFGKLEDVINVVNFFIDDRSDFVTGQVIYLGGVNH